MSLKTRGILVVIIGTAMALSLSLGGGVLATRDKLESGELSWEQARLFAEVMQRVKQNYVEPVDDDVLLESALRGMVSDLDDHSQYLDAEEYQDIRISTTGSYSGVGLEVSAEDGVVIVVAPIDNTPAERAGILGGDTIIAVDGKIVTSDHLHETIAKMRGRAGTSVTVTVTRENEERPIIFELRRESIRVASVSHEILQSGVGYVRVSQFNDSTAKELSQAIDDMQDRKDGMLDGLILDLRNNPGGVLDSAIDVSDLFLDAGIIVVADGRTAESRFTRKANRGDVLDGAGMIVLVNSGSASASEIVAGALQDHNRAMVVGTSTFGKGLVQTVMPLSRGRAIKLTTSRFYTPSGDSIHEKGIFPDVVVEETRQPAEISFHASADHEHDAQLQEALSLLTPKSVMQSKAE
ncbi:MAG: S41 family peptidase [Proteobacteria bacterium]|nr:S41 family peptidase [Pseudomonadota bacterium]